MSAATDPAAAAAEMREAAHLARRRTIRSAEAPPLTVRDDWPVAAPAAPRKGTPGEWLSAIAIAVAVYIALWVT